MQVTFELPDEVALPLQRDLGDLSRHALESLVAEGVATRRISAWQARQTLGYATPMQLDALLQQHGVWREYAVEEIEQDAQASRAARSAR
jgi:hypothetical protein